MARITKEYENKNNGGRERVSRDGDRYYINSYINAGTGWLGELEVSRGNVKRCMDHTAAPADVVSAILGDGDACQ